MPLRRRPYQRSLKPDPIRLTTRDKRILETIHSFDGLLSLRQIDKLFFSGQGRSQSRARMRLLFDNGYVNMPDLESIHQVPAGETIYWLDKKGAAIVAGLSGKRTSQLKWRKRPRYSLIEHDLKVNDFRIVIQDACRSAKDSELRYWIPESAFASQPDKITYETSSGKSAIRAVRPDGFFLIDYQARFGRVKPFSFLLEVDMSSEDNPRFVREKIRPGVAYLKSAQYVERFGQPHGRYLVITTGRRRMLNMKEQAERHGGRNLFYFSTFDDLRAGTVLAKPVWLLAGHQEPRSIVPS